MNYDQHQANKRRIFQKFKAMTLDGFWRWMNIAHTRAYQMAERHYQEAMDIELQPKQKERVLARAAKIREEWDGIGFVEVDPQVIADDMMGRTTKE